MTTALRSFTRRFLWPYKVFTTVLFLVGCLLLAFGIACTGEGGGEGEELAAEGGTVTCLEVNGSVEWTFDFEVSGPASDDGATVYVETADVPNSDGYAMTLLGRQGNSSVQFRTVVGGTASGEEAVPGNLPYDCSQTDALSVQFCAVHVGTADRPCWACGDGSAGSPPGGAVGWVACGL